MSFNFKEALEGLNISQFVEEDAEKILKATVQKAKDLRIEINSIECVRFAITFDEEKYYISAYLVLKNNTFADETLTVETAQTYEYAISVIQKISEKLKEQGIEFFALDETVKSFNQEFKEMKNNIKIINSYIALI